MNNLDLLNTLRQANGKPALKSWKESKAKLEEAIQKESPKTLNIAKDNELTSIIKEVDKELKQKVKTVKRTIDGKRSVKQEPVKSVASKEGKSTAQILKDFGINPKIGRALLRRHGVERTEEAITKFLKGRSK